MMPVQSTVLNTLIRMDRTMIADHGFLKLVNSKKMLVRSGRTMSENLNWSTFVYVPISQVIEPTLFCLTYTQIKSKMVMREATRHVVVARTRNARAGNYLNTNSNLICEYILYIVAG